MTVTPHPSIRAFHSDHLQNQILKVSKRLIDHQSSFTLRMSRCWSSLLSPDWTRVKLHRVCLYLQIRASSIDLHLALNFESIVGIYSNPFILFLYRTSSTYSLCRCTCSSTTLSSSSKALVAEGEHWQKLSRFTRKTW